MAKRKKLTPKQRVLKKYPDARLERSTGGVVYQPWFLWRNRSDRQLTADLIGCGETQAEAWKDAAERIEGWL